LASFSAGAIAATSTLDRQVQAGAAHPRPSPLLAVEAALLAFAAAWLASSGIDHDAALSIRAVPVIVTAAAAMGMQAVSLRAVGETAVSTTYGTGALVRLSEKLALSIRRAPRPTEAPRRNAIVVLAAVLASYVAGATVGAQVPSTPVALLVPCAIAAGTSAWLQRDQLLAIS
jgi:uncharacterized membrane protein YoaK (UPF0700 family)